MRFVVIVLVLANIGYLAWQLSESEAGVTGGTRPVTEGKRLTMLSELAHDPTGAPNASVEMPLTGSAPVGESGEAAATGETLRAGGGGGPGNEAESVSADAPNLVAESAASEPPAVDAVVQCYSTGPFSDFNAAEAVVSALGDQSFALNIVSEDRPVAVRDYRVLLPPAASLEAAFRKLRELQGQNIDSYVIARGRHALGISLGVFSTLKAAEGAQRNITGKGYAAEIVPMGQSVRDYWVVGTSEQLLSHNLAQEDPPLFEPRDCPEQVLAETAVSPVADGTD